MAEHRVRVAIKRVYEKPDPTDGTRILVDRLWARGVSKDAADLDAWMKELGPTDELRTWFGHQPNRWDAFVETYRHELATPLRQLLLAELQGVAGGRRSHWSMARAIRSRTRPWSCATICSRRERMQMTHGTPRRNFS